MSNIHGKAYAMNTVSPMKPWKTYILRLFFFVWRHYKPLGDGLVQLSFIHFARWVIVPRHAFPRLSEQQPKDDLRTTTCFSSAISTAHGTSTSTRFQQCCSSG